VLADIYGQHGNTPLANTSVHVQTRDRGQSSRCVNNCAVGLVGMGSSLRLWACHCSSYSPNLLWPTELHWDRDSI